MFSRFAFMKSSYWEPPAWNTRMAMMGLANLNFYALIIAENIFRKFYWAFLYLKWPYKINEDLQKTFKVFLSSWCNFTFTYTLPLPYPILTLLYIWLYPTLLPSSKKISKKNFKKISKKSQSQTSVIWPKCSLFF